jgi:hypothetical protein
MTRRQLKSQVSPRKHARYRMIVLSLAILSHPDPDEAHLHPSLPLAANCTVVPAPCDRAMGRPACSSQPIVGDVRRKLTFFSLRHNAISTDYTSFMPSWPATFLTIVTNATTGFPWSRMQSVLFFRNSNRRGDSARRTHPSNHDDMRLDVFMPP